MSKLLNKLSISGIINNKTFLQSVFENSVFIDGKYNTSFIENNYIDLISRKNKNIDLLLIAAFLKVWIQRNSARKALKNIPSGWRNVFYDYQSELFSYNNEKIHLKYKYHKNNCFEIKINDKTFASEIINCFDNFLELIINDVFYSFTVSQNKDNIYIHNSIIGENEFILNSRFPSTEKQEKKGEYKSPLPGEIIKIDVKKYEKNFYFIIFTF